MRLICLDLKIPDFRGQNLTRPPKNPAILGIL